MDYSRGTNLIAGRHHEGNPAAGVRSSQLEAEWVNMIDDELVGLIEAAGLKPDYAARDQVEKAILALSGRQFPTLTAARAAAAAGVLEKGAVVSVGGYASPGDGGGFVGGVDGADDVRYPGGGRIRPVEKWARPEWFGVLGAGDDARLVQAALDLYGACELSPDTTYRCRADMHLNAGEVIRGAGRGSLLHFDGAGLKLDAARAEMTAPYLWEFVLDSFAIKRVGAAGPALEAKGKNVNPNKGVARGHFSGIKILGSTGAGVQLTDFYIHTFTDLLVTQCDIGVFLDVNPSTLIGANDVRFFGGEINGNRIGVYIRRANNIAFYSVGVEGNGDSAVIIDNNVKYTTYGLLMKACRFEKNGYKAIVDGVAPPDIVIGSANPNSPTAIAIEDCFFTTGGLTKPHAIYVAKCDGLVIHRNGFNGYGVSAIKHAPASGGAVKGTYRDNIAAGGLPIADRYNRHFRPALEDARQAFTMRLPATTIPAGGQIVKDIVIKGGASGDQVMATRSGGWDSLQVTASLYEAGGLRLALFNPTANPIALAPATIRIAIIPQEYDA